MNRLTCLITLLVSTTAAQAEFTREVTGGGSSPIPIDPGEPFGFHTNVQLDYLVARAGLDELVAKGAVVKLDLYDDGECKSLAWEGYADLSSPDVVVHALDRISPLGREDTRVAEIRTIREIITDRPLRGAFLQIVADGIEPSVAPCQPQRLSRPVDPPVPTGWILMDNQPSVTYANAYTFDPFEREILGTTDEMICALNMVDQSDNTVLFGGWMGKPRCEVKVVSGEWQLTATIGSDADAGSYDSSSWATCSALCWPIAQPEDVYPWWQLD